MNHPVPGARGPRASTIPQDGQRARRPVEKGSAEERDLARAEVRRRATSAADYTMLLDMLGIEEAL